MDTPSIRSAFRSTTTVRVLIADPDGDARRVYVEALRPLGCDSVEAADGREALVEALVRRPSVILMESRLPLVNGPALCEILRRDTQTRMVPIVALAAVTASADMERIRRAGADSVLIKPVAATALVSELRRVMAWRAGDGADRDADLTPPPEPVAEAADTGPPKRMANSKAHVRCTTMSPPISPPVLRCPACDGPLIYEHSHLGGVNQRQPEQWDDFVCPACGTFEYRHRTRRLRELASR
jgi:two-component system, cell cycle response regulator DivK